MRSASISIGIVNYLERPYRESDMRLRYAVKDAIAFSHWAAFAWGGRTDAEEHRLICDQEVTEENLQDAFLRISTLGRIDVFFLYLSGHGEEGDGTGGWFCLADALPEVKSLDGPKLDKLLSLIDAEHVVVIIDCCHAEAVAVGMTFFSSLAGRKGRLLLASARASQRAWEDDHLERSVFSDVLLRALSTGSSIADAAGRVDVETRLLAYLREQVPLEAAARKRGYVQEPVMGGLLATPLLLPVVSSKSLGRPLTMSETIRSGVRRILIAVVVASLVGLILLEFLVYYMVVSATGKIVIRPGLPSTYSLLPVHLVAPIDTGFAVDDLDLRNDPMIVSLAEGTIWGFSTHRNEHGLKKWVGALEPSLQAPGRALIRAFAYGEALPLNAGETPPPTDETIFLARLSGTPVSQVAGTTYDLKYDANIECASNALRSFNFTLLLPPSDVFVQEVAWRVATAPEAAADRAQHLVDLVKIAAYRNVHEKSSEARDDEITAFTWSVASIATADWAKQLREFAAPVLKAAHGTWCGLHAAFVLALVGDEVESRAAEAEISAAFGTFDRSVQGDLPTAEQSLASAALVALAQRRPLEIATLDTLAAMIERDGADLAMNTPPNALLSELATEQSLTPQLQEYLFERLRSPSREFDFEPLAAFRILASNARFLNDAQRTALRQWLRVHAAENRTMSDLHEGLGFLALSVPVDKYYIELLAASLSPASRFPPRATNYRGEMVITADGGEAVVALGRIAQVILLDTNLVDRLVSIASGRSDLPQRDSILKGLASQWYRGTKDIAAAIYTRLAATRSEALRRNLEVEVIVAGLSTLVEPEREQVMKRLLSLWREESEPELRIALGRVIAGLPLSGSLSKAPKKHIPGLEKLDRAKD